MNLNFEYGDSKTAVVDVDSEGKIHRAVLTDDEESVIVYYGQEEYPRWSIYTASLKEYVKIIEHEDWIQKSLSDEDQKLLQDLTYKEANKK